jgi:hypothetical protein
MTPATGCNAMGQRDVSPIEGQGRVTFVLLGIGDGYTVAAFMYRPRIAQVATNRSRLLGRLHERLMVYKYSQAKTARNDRHWKN